MSNIFEETKRQGNFTEMVYAEALFFQRGLLTPTIRVQAPSIAMVFTDGVNLGAGSSTKSKTFLEAHLPFNLQIWMDTYFTAIFRIYRLRQIPLITQYLKSPTILLTIMPKSNFAKASVRSTLWFVVQLHFMSCICQRTFLSPVPRSRSGT